MNCYGLLRAHVTLKWINHTNTSDKDSVTNCLVLRASKISELHIHITSGSKGSAKFTEKSFDKSRGLAE